MNATADRVFFLSLGRKSRIMSVGADGSDPQLLIGDLESKPDGISVDPVNGHIYYTFMGVIWKDEDFWENDGHIERANLDGSDRKVVVPVGKFVTGKQIQYDGKTGRIYWSDREGMRVMSSRTDGSDLTVHVQTGAGDVEKQDRRRHCVGVTVDPKGGYLYWTQKGKPKGNEGQILRAPLEARPADPSKRTDIEVLASGLPEPIDLEWDGADNMLYWTDRGDPPKGNTLNRARIRDGKIADHEILLSGLHEAIGLALDHENRRAFVSDLKGSLYLVDLDHPSTGKIIYQNKGALTGIAYLKGQSAA